MEGTKETSFFWRSCQSFHPKPELSKTSLIWIKNQFKNAYISYVFFYLFYDLVSSVDDFEFRFDLMEKKFAAQIQGFKIKQINTVSCPTKGTFLKPLLSRHWINRKKTFYKYFLKSQTILCSLSTVVIRITFLFCFHHKPLYFSRIYLSLSKFFKNQKLKFENF